MPIRENNLNAIRSLSVSDHPTIGVNLYEILRDIISNQNTANQQNNSNPNGQPQPPPNVSGMNVVAQNGHFQISIQDNNQDALFRGVQYHVEHADNPQFTNSHTVSLGPSRNHNLELGNVTRYFRAYSSYASSPISQAVYHGSETAPIAVTGGGSNGGPAFLPSEGSGTGFAGQGLSGPGPVPFRSTTGKPASR